MSNLSLVYYPDPRLQQACKLIEKVTPEIKELAKNMIETMYAENGIGLAAPQVGLQIRMTVVDVSEDQNQPLVLINPEIISKQGNVNSEEGCLSIPGYRDIVKRAAEISVKALDLDGQEFQIDAKELLARCIQHEIDHLDGVLFIDRLSRLKKDLFKKWFQKNAESY